MGSYNVWVITPLQECASSEAREHYRHNILRDKICFAGAPPKKKINCRCVSTQAAEEVNSRYRKLAQTLLKVNNDKVEAASHAFEQAARARYAASAPSQNVELSARRLYLRERRSLYMQHVQPLWADFRHDYIEEFHNHPLYGKPDPQCGCVGGQVEVPDNGERFCYSFRYEADPHCVFSDPLVDTAQYDACEWCDRRGVTKEHVAGSFFDVRETPCPYCAGQGVVKKLEDAGKRLVGEQRVEVATITIVSPEAVCLPANRLLLYLQDGFPTRQIDTLVIDDEDKGLSWFRAHDLCPIECDTGDPAFAPLLKKTVEVFDWEDLIVKHLKKKPTNLVLNLRCTGG